MYAEKAEDRLLQAGRGFSSLSCLTLLVTLQTPINNKVKKRCTKVRKVDNGSSIFHHLSLVYSASNRK